MKSHRASGYKHELERGFVWDLKWRARSSDNATFKEQLRALQLSETTANMALRIQSRWRANRAKYYVAALLQERQCSDFMEELRTGRSHLCHLKCKGCLEGEQAAKTTSKVNQLMFADSASVLFGGDSELLTPRLRVYDTGENWNQRYREACELPEDSAPERLTKAMMLNSIDRDFTTAAATYAKTIISEYFLHSKDKSIHPRSIGGVAGGEKYLWRGILFKLADGSSGPWNGSDEAAAKAAGHDLRGNASYQKAARELDLPLNFPLMALIDYKGFRMTAQAFVPLRQTTPSLVMGSSDGGRNVANSDAELNSHLSKIAAHLRLKAHQCGKERITLPVACDIEGHVGADGRYYILDLARFMPPEHPSPFDDEPSHLDDFIPDGSEVLVRLPTQDGKHRDFNGHIARAHRIDRSYDVVLEGGHLVRRVPSDRLQDCQMSVFWRLLRPEFVRNRGSDLGLQLGSQPAEGERESAWQLSSGTDSGGYEPFDASGGGNLGEPASDVCGYCSLGDAPGAGSTPGALPQLLSGYDTIDAIKARDSLADPAGSGTVRGEGGKAADVAKRLFLAKEGDAPDLKRKSEHQELPSPVKKALKHPASPSRIEDFNPQERGSYFSFVEPLPEASASDDEASSPQEESFTTGYQPLPTAKGANEGRKRKASGSAISMTEDGETSEAPALSPDALTAFGMHDPEIYEHNRQIKESTQLLFGQVISTLAQRLLEECSTPEKVKSLNLSREMHARGVNMRHLGLLRKHIPEHSPQPGAQGLRELMLREIVGRTLKQLLRDYMRRWMRSERSSSEFGLIFLVTQFLNLTTGAHGNRDTFWNERVVTGIAQRFGIEALSDSDRRDLFCAVSGAATLKAIVKTLCESCGIVLTHMVQLQFFQDEKPLMFEFNVVDVVKLEAHVKHPGFSELAKSEMLSLLAAHKRKEAHKPEEPAPSPGVKSRVSSGRIKRSDARVVRRLERQASYSYEAARVKIPMSEPLVGDKQMPEATPLMKGNATFGEELAVLVPEALAEGGVASALASAVAQIPNGAASGYTDFENGMLPEPPLSTQPFAPAS